MKNNEPKTLGQRIRMVRGGLTQMAFAEKVGIKQAMVSRYEAGHETPSPRVLLRIARYHDCSIEWLLTGKELPAGPRLTTAERVTQAAKQLRKTGNADAKEFSEMMTHLFLDRRTMQKVLSHYRFMKR
ncbi:MAG TPA: helix-turn-helix domain-containing protein [bacterium]|nr:helix-turn-helix domain-containing protein [bacterium]